MISSWVWRADFRPRDIKGVSEVALSDWDQRQLARIEAGTLATDPGFAARMDLTGAVHSRRQLRRMCWCLLALGAWLLLTGMARADGVISLGALSACCGCGLMVWSALTARSLRVPTQRRR